MVDKSSTAAGSPSDKQLSSLLSSPTNNLGLGLVFKKFMVLADF